MELDLATIPPEAQGLILGGEPGREGRWSAAGQGALLLRHIGALTPAGAEALRRLLARRAEQGVGPLLLLTGMRAELLGLTRHTLLYRLEKYKIGDPG